MIYRIKAMAAGGDGVAVPEAEEDSQSGLGDEAGPRRSRVVFLSGVAPGDRVEVVRTARVRGVDRALEWRLVEAGPHRVEPACSHAPVCGGCPWMQVDYEAQVREKTGLLERALRQAHLLDQLGDQIVSVHPSHDILGYRRRARLFWIAGERGVVLGFHAASSHEIVDVTESACPVLEAPLAEALSAVARALETAFAMDRTWNQGQVFMLADGEGRVQVALQAGREHARPIPWTSRDDSPARLLFDEAESVVGVGLWTGRGGWIWVGGEELVLDPASGLRGAAPGFAQANRTMDDLVRAEAARLAGEGARVLELYAGSGNVTRNLARAGRQITAVESDPDAVARMARAAPAWPGRIKPRRADAARFVHKALAKQQYFDLVVVDPPRKGLGKIAKLIPGLKSRRVVMVSCDPMTASRDLAVLGQAGYRLRSIQGFDTMPHTSHFELVALAELPQESSSV